MKIKSVLAAQVAAALVLFLFGCDSRDSSSPQGVSRSDTQTYNYSDDQGDVAESSELDSGSYSCEAENTTRANGPYSLDCEKIGNEVIIHFPNGGYISTDVSSEENDGSGSWTIEAEHPESGDTWEVQIDE